jgi:hypothetical protein
MERIAEASGVAVFEDGDRIVFARYADEVSFLYVFFLGVATLFLLMGALTSESRSDALVWFSLLVVAAAAFALMLRRFVRRKRNARALAPFAVIDMAARKLFDGSGAVIAPLDDLYIALEFRLISSFRSLVVRYRSPGRFFRKKLVLVHGALGGTSVRTIAAVLRERGLMS